MHEQQPTLQGNMGPPSDLDTCKVRLQDFNRQPESWRSQLPLAWPTGGVLAGRRSFPEAACSDAWKSYQDDFPVSWSLKVRVLTSTVASSLAAP